MVLLTFHTPELQRTMRMFRGDIPPILNMQPCNKTFITIVLAAGIAASPVLARSFLGIQATKNNRFVC